MNELFLGYEVWAGSRRACIEEIVKAIDAGERRWLACINPHSYAVAVQRPSFRDSLKSADWLVPDGAGVILGSRICGGSIRERITGSDIFEGVCGSLDRRGGARIFFLGSTPETLSAISSRLALDWPGLVQAGFYSPPFKAEFSCQDIDAMVEAINSAKPDVLWVGMTAPKQEEWISAVLQRIDVKFAAAIGAVFDFYAGRIRRSHPLFQQVGLEWLPRLLQEPRRLWRRTFVSAPIFLAHAIRARLEKSGR